MRFIKFAFFAIITVVLIYLLDKPQKIGATDIPALGKFFSPFTGFWQNAESKKDFQDQSINFDIFKEPVRIIYDNRLVPHIFAQNIEDAVMAQGYVTAKHRLWQMDISTRSTGGRLSEILGEKVLERDKLQRRKGLLFAAENAVKGWQKNEKDFNLIEKYAEGVNAYINTLSPKEYPIEFKLLGYAPEKWTPLHTALYSKAMAQALCMREFDLECNNAQTHFGDEIFNFLYPEYNPKQAPIVPSEVQYDFKPQEVRPLSEPKDNQQFGYIEHDIISKPPPFIGSNNWAVAPSKTKNGKAIYCTDPHLSLTLPSYWYEVHLNTPNLNVYGVSLPGVPGVIMGFNDNIAWGMTNVGHDVVDWYNIKWKDDSKKQYVLDGKAKNIEFKIETFEVKNLGTITDSVKYTNWGPIVYESDDSPYQDMAMRWLGHDESNPNEMGVFLDLNQGKNYNDYANALKNYDAPAQNVAFASTKGDIALHPSGKFPLKRKGQGRSIQDGSKSSHAWQGFIPKEHNPYVKNPSSGFVGSANQRTTDDSYPYYYNASFDDYRGRYLHQKLATMQDITVQDMQALQNDNYSIEAAELLPLLLAKLNRKNLNKDQRAILRTLQDWDYRFEADLLAPTFYRLWSKHFYKKTWDEIYDFEKATLLKPELWRTIELFEKDPSNDFFDNKSTPEKEDAVAIATAAFEAMTTDLKEYPNEGKDLIWSTYKHTRINHLGQIPAFTYNNIPIGGFHHALNAVQEGFGPSWRMVVEMGDPINATGIYPGGQSGNPGSPYYDNMVEDWAAGRYQKLLFVNSPDEIIAHKLYEEKLK